jgi:YbbR domain-containing protein
VTEAGEKFFDIQFKLPNGAALEKTSAGTVTVYLDNKVSKTLPVEAKLFNYQMSSEYTLVTSEIPDIVITGPEQIVNSIARAELPVDFQNSEITSGRIYSGKIELVGSDGTAISESDRRYIRLSSDTASVTVSLYGNATVPIAVTFKHGIQDPESCTFKLSHKTLNVYGEIGAIKDLTVNCVIDEKTLKSGTSVKYAVGLPSGVQSVDNVTSIKVTVTIKNYSETELTVPVFDAEGYHVANLPVKFRGERDLISRLTIANVKATAKPADGETGTVNAPVTFEFFGEFAGKIYETYKEGSPYTVSVTVQGRGR